MRDVVVVIYFIATRDNQKLHNKIELSIQVTIRTPKEALLYNVIYQVT